VGAIAVTAAGIQHFIPNAHVLKGERARCSVTPANWKTVSSFHFFAEPRVDPS
jgi:hypothetical protein